MPQEDKNRSVADQRRVYPTTPSPRIIKARQQNAAEARKKKAAIVQVAKQITDPFAKLQRRHTEVINRPDPVPSGACLFHRDECRAKDKLFSGRAAELFPGDHPPVLKMLARRVEDAGEDLPTEELPPLANAFGAAVSDGIRAGRWGLVAALEERMPQVGADGSTPRFHPAKPSRAPASAHVVRHLHELPGRSPPVPQPSRPSGPLSLRWVACSIGALMKYARTGVARNWERDLEVRDAGSPKGSVPIQSAIDAENGPLRLQQKWPRAFAIGPCNALRDCTSAGHFFEVTVEMALQEREHFESRSQAREEPGQRPLLHLGVGSSKLPVSDETINDLEDLQEAFGDDFWTISTSGSVHSAGVSSGTVQVTWPSTRIHPPRPVRPRLCFNMNLLVAENGALHLWVDGENAVNSPAGLVPLNFARAAGSLSPVAVIGPNVATVTLRPLAC